MEREGKFDDRPRQTASGSQIVCDLTLEYTWRPEGEFVVAKMLFSPSPVLDLLLSPQSQRRWVDTVVGFVNFGH